MVTRDEVEAEIAADGATLSAIASLLKAQQSLEEWPKDLLVILGAALSASGSAAEVRKAANLRRHLFRGADIPGDLVQDIRNGEFPGLSRRSERVRADLAGVVAYGCGARLGL